jgi:hypothetical protein
MGTQQSQIKDQSARCRSIINQLDSNQRSISISHYSDNLQADSVLGE